MDTAEKRLKASLGFFAACRLSCEAIKDAKGAFGEDLSNYHMALRRSDKGKALAAMPIFPVSNYMALLVDMCKKECETLISRSSKNGLSDILAEIQESFNRWDSLSIGLNGIEPAKTIAIKAIDDEIVPLREQLDVAEKNRLIINETGQVEKDMDVVNLNELNQRIVKLRDKIAYAEQKRKEMLDSSEANSKSSRELIENVQNTINTKLPEAKKRIDDIAEQLNVIYSNYEVSYSYYWLVACRKRKCLITKKPFSEICAKCGYTMLNRNDIFSERRNELKRIALSKARLDIEI